VTALIYPDPRKSRSVNLRGYEEFLLGKVL